MLTGNHEQSSRVGHRLQFPNRLELVLKSVPNRFEESSFARHANICIYGQGPFKYYVSMFEPDLGENILVD